jgi:hypothetical protein
LPATGGTSSWQATRPIRVSLKKNGFSNEICQCIWCSGHFIEMSCCTWFSGLTWFSDNWYELLYSVQWLDHVQEGKHSNSLILWGT